MLDDYKTQLKETGKISLRIKVHAGAKTTRIKSILSDNTIKVDIAKAPEDGKANESLIKLLADEFEVSKSSVQIAAGKFSGDKLVNIIKVS
ncbi:MAG: DUF167 domain-containing protein [Candidatus Falkowbacteria bacterium]|nr:DUF167 domain-containing protein [Candidatus Falkowbacteria bacterium]